MRNKFFIVVALSVLPALGGCAAIQGWLDTPIAEEHECPKVEEPAPGDTSSVPPAPLPPAPPSPTIGDAIIDTVGGAVGTATGNPVIGIAVAGILAALYGTIRGKTAKRAAPAQENKV